MTATTELPARRRMSQRRAGYTTSVTIAGADFYLTANPNPDGTLGEIFIKFGKQGSTLGGLLDAVSISVSIGLQSGVPLRTFVSKYTTMRFEPLGLTDDPDVTTTTTSVLDYVFRRLALDFLDEATRNELRIFSLDEETRQLTNNGSFR
jgi:ribonucleoside-diphosphate reductase alpha chain